MCIRDRHLRSAQERYKRNYDNRLGKNDETIKLGDYVFLRTEKKDDKDSRHKLAQIAEGPYLVKQTDDKSKTVVIEYDDKTVENVSRSRVVRAPKRQTPAEIQNVVQPTVTNATFVDYPNTEYVNQSHSPAAEKTTNQQSMNQT